jgi:hypothetical protein
VAEGDIGSDRFNRLWIESGIPLEGQEFDVANIILAKAPNILLSLDCPKDRTYH